MLFRAIASAGVSPALRAVFEEYREAYRAWFCREGEASRPGLDACVVALRAHLPELAPLHAGIAAALGMDELEARFLSLYRPPPIVRGCSQVVVREGKRAVLVRNYDHAPHLLDGVVLRAEWLGGPTLVMTDCLWGALDGVNAHGLCGALAFGGSRTVGDGFAASLVLRYVLQTCATVREAAEALRRVPVYLAYTFAFVDAAGDHRTVYTSPGHPARVTRDIASANHQERISWVEYAAYSRTTERVACLRDLAPHATVAEVVEAMHRPPLFQRDYERGFGTLYTSVYDPADRSLTLHWRGRSERWSLDEFGERAVTIRYPVVESSERQSSAAMRLR